MVLHPSTGLSNWKDLLRGVGDAAREPQLRGVLLTVFFTSLLCGPLITFVPVLVRGMFRGDAARFSIAVGAFGLGGLAGAVTLLFVDHSVDRRTLTSWFAGLYGVTIVIVAMNTWFIPLLGLLALAGLSMSISNTSANTLAQSISLPAFRGQTVSLYMLSIRGGVSMGALLTGISVSAMGIRHAFLLNGILAIVAQVAVMRSWARPRSRLSVGAGEKVDGSSTS